MADQFFRSYQGRLKPSTLRDYRSIMSRHILTFPTIEALNMGLEPYLSNLALSGKRKNNILSTARTFIAWARRRELWDGRFHNIPRFPHRSRKTKPLSPDEARLIMDFSPPGYKDFFRVAILTGLRTGELLALQFEDFDLRRRVLRISRALSGGQVSTTKSLAGEREIPILRPVWEIYEHRQRANRRGSPWFFYSGSHGVMGLGTIRKVWKAMLEAFEIEPRILYATRHTFASLAIAAGEDPMWVAQVMGHSRPDQLFLRYASFLEGVKDDGQKFLKLAIGGSSLLRAVT